MMLYHQYSQFKNQELDWLPADSEHAYQYNLQHKRDQLIKYSWLDSKFTYKFNSHGFRSDEFTDDHGIMSLGCSFTVGIGLPVEHTWPSQVASSLNLKCFNLGIGGVGPDTAFRLANYYIPKIKPRLVIYLETPPGRFSLLTNDTSNNYDFTVHNYSDANASYREFYQQWISLEENIELHNLKHQLAIKQLCQEHNTKFIFMPEHQLIKLDLARDLVHYGIESHTNLSNKILEQL